MKYIGIIISLIFFEGVIVAQLDTLPETSVIESIIEAGAKAKVVSVDLSNPEEVEIVLKKIHTFRYLESIVFEGESEDDELNKILYRLSVLKNLRSITLKENDLKKIPESISSLKNIENLTVEGNTGLDYNDLCTKLGNLNIAELNLLDNNLKENSVSLKKISSLKKLKITGSNQLDYKELFEQLSDIPGLTALAIPVNFLTELPDNITKLKALQLLDVSDNVLTDLPEGLSSLKAINNLSIQGNLMLSPAKDLEKLRGNDIRFLAIDKEVSGEEVEQIKKMFPNAELNFPVEPEEEEIQEPTSAAVPEFSKNVRRGELKTKKVFGIMSGAYLLYPSLFRGIIYNFDTLRFEERYSDLNYTNVYQRLPGGQAMGGQLSFGRYFSLFNLKKSRKKIFYIYPNQTLSVNYPELRAFSGMNWMYQGELSARKFKKKFVHKTWSDIRIEFDKNNSVFTIHVKTAKGFEKFNAYPFTSFITPLEKTQQTYSRRFLLYQRALLRRAEQFKRNHTREKRRYDSNFKSMQNYAWKELQLSMSNEEKLMSREEWLEYYDNIVANEKKALDNTSLSLAYLIRRLTLEGNNTAANGLLMNEDYDPRIKNLNIDFVDENGSGKLAVSNIIVVDGKNKLFSQSSGTLGLIPNRVFIKQFSSYYIFVELRNGNMGLVSSEEIDKKNFQSGQVCELKVKVFDKNLNTIGDLMGSTGIK